MTWLILFALYFLPTICALIKGHHNALAIGILNFFLGWTFIGWVMALVWAATATRPREEVVRPVVEQRPQIQPEVIQPEVVEPEVIEPDRQTFREWWNEGAEYRSWWSKKARRLDPATWWED